MWRTVESYAPKLIEFQISALAEGAKFRQNLIGSFGDETFGLTDTASWLHIRYL